MTTVADLARRLNSAHPEGRSLPALIMMTDDRRLPDPIPAARLLPPGALVIFRHYGAPERETVARALRRVCHVRRLLLLIAGDWRLATRIGADGIHLPEALVGRAGGWRRRPDWLVTAAAHSPAALCRARAAGVDAVLLAPVFATVSHPEAISLGPLRFAGLVRDAGLPVYALGGIANLTARRLQGSGAVGIAAIGALSRGRTARLSNK